MIDKQTAFECKTWPFREARSVLERIGDTPPEKGYVLFETGYGPSGLPHIGTFGEVCRTSMVMTAFRALSDVPVKLVCFSDDMDGLRKVPENVPNQEMLSRYIGYPLSRIPDPFEEYESYAAHNNARLRAFLDRFGFTYEFLSSTYCYTSGNFDSALMAMLKNYEAVRNAVLPILSEARKQTYSPFLPISPVTGKVLQVPIDSTDPDNGTITYTDEDGTQQTVPVTGGGVKCQWRADWGLRWHALDVDYEMAGEDLESSARIAADIVKTLGGVAPAGFHYKLFVDEHGEKISKSKGNGLSMDQWLTYAPSESLAYFMYQRPGSAKKLHFDIIPKNVDDYITFVHKLPEQEPEKMLENPAWYIHNGLIPSNQYTPVPFALLLNLANVSNAADRETMWGFITRYAPQSDPETAPFLEELIGYALRYYADFVKPAKQYRLPDEREARALADLAQRLDALSRDADFETIQTEVFSAGKENGYTKSELKYWFQAIYEVCLGQSQGPRFGSFIELYGIDNSAQLIRDALNGKFVNDAA